MPFGMGGSALEVFKHGKYKSGLSCLCGLRGRFLLYNENHSQGEWFERRL